MPFKARTVLQLDKVTGKVIKEYASMYKAEMETDIFSGHICRCCKGELKSAGGYRWKYKE